MGGQEGDDGALTAVSTAATTSGGVGNEAPMSDVATIDGKEEDSPTLGSVSTPSKRGLAGLAFSHVKVEEFASIPGEPDDDDVEPASSSPLVSLGHARDGKDRERQDSEAFQLQNLNHRNNQPVNAFSHAPNFPKGRDASEEMYGGGTTSDPTSEQGDLDPTSRARDLISRDLLDELSHEPSNWNENYRHPPTPPHGGFDTPSEPGTPRATQAQQYWKHSNEGLSCIDQWDWKTDAPEFVPGNLKGMLGHADSQVVGTPFSQPGTWALHSGPTLPNGGATTAGSDDMARLSELRGNYEWQLRSKSEALVGVQQRMNKLEIEAAQVRASWEVERRSLMRQVSHYRAVLERYCIPVDDSGTGYSMEDPHTPYFPVFEPSTPSQWSMVAENASGQAPIATGRPATSSSSGGAFTAPACQVPLGNDSRQLRVVGASSLATTSAIAKRDVEGDQAKSSLDSKMRQLNSLLREDNNTTVAQKNRQPSPDSSGQDNDPAQGGGNTYSGSSIASTLRAMFPHATIRTKMTPGENGEDDEDDAMDNDLAWPAGENGSTARHRPDANQALSISKIVDTLEDITGCQIDDRAWKALQALPKEASLEALARVKNVLEEGGGCRNLSSVMQSVCKRMETRTTKAGRYRNKYEDSAVDTRHPDGSRERLHSDGGRYRRARRFDEEEGDAFASSESEGDVAAKARGSEWHRDGDRVASRAAAKTTREEEARERSKEVQKAVQQADLGGGTSKRSSAGSKSWADLEDGDDDDKDAWEKDNDVWTHELVDRVARKGFNLSRRGDHWNLSILMGQLEPPLTETGMERYCRWLRTRLAAFRQEHGQDALWSCRGEVDFSHNQMSNQMVWMLLETLAQHEVHTALLKLYSNRISQGGVLAICEFLRQNERPEALQELHLSHNEIDDESALELLRTLKSTRPRYPLQRSGERSGNHAHVPVWLRLSHNRIRDPNGVLNAAEEEGVTVCTEWDRHVRGSSKSVRQDRPIAHLDAFTTQDVPKQDKNNGNRDGGRRAPG